jgi:hypothetical protein
MQQPMSIAPTSTKSQVVDQILVFNASAPREWLLAFDFAALEGYLQRLRLAVQRNAGRAAGEGTLKFAVG